LSFRWKSRIEISSDKGSLYLSLVVYLWSVACMSTYHVLLPPTTLTSLESLDIPRLKFQKLDPPHSISSQHDWSALIPPPSGVSNLGHGSPSIDSHRRVDGAGIMRDAEDRDEEDDANKSRTKAMGVKRSRGPLRKTQTDVTVSDTSRRRSTRLGRRTSGKYPLRATETPAARVWGPSVVQD
jgi:hypothetical protein